MHVPSNTKKGVFEVSFEKSNSTETDNRHIFSKALPAFDEAMKKIISVPKSEVERREQTERDAKSSSK